MFRKPIFILLFLLLTSLTVLIPRDAAEAGGPFPPPPSVEELIKFAVPDSTPQLNFMDPASPLYGKIPPLPPRKTPRLAGRQGAAASPNPVGPSGSMSPTSIDDEWGTDIKAVSPALSNPAVYANQQVNATLLIPDGSDLYAPTLLGSNGTRYEAVTAYHNWGGMSRAFAIYDHYLGAWTPVAKTLDSTFLSTYTSGGYYTTVVQKVSGVWYVYLWNYLTSQWEDMMLRGNQDGPYSIGWDIYESHLNTCADLPSFRSQNLQVLTTSGWQLVTSSYGSEHSLLVNCAYYTTWNNQYHTWTIDPR